MMFILSMAVILAFGGTAFAESPPAAMDSRSDLLEAKLIKIRRMAADWGDAPMELRLRDGVKLSGRFINLDGTDFQLQTASGLQRTPAASVEAVVLKRRPRDLIFVALAALGSAAICSGMVSLGGNASSGSAAGAGAAGAVVGFSLGWSVLYQDTVVRIE